MPSSGRWATVDPPVVDGRATRDTLTEIVSAETINGEPPVVNEQCDSREEILETSAVTSSTVPANNQGVSQRSLWSKLAWHWPAATLGATWNLLSLTVLLAVVAAIPIVQLVSLGYLLRAAANLSAGQAWRTALPGVRLAGRIATFAMLTALLWVPVWLVTDLSYSVQLLRPNTAQAAAWRGAAFLIAFVWLTWITWAAMRGGRWWHLLWPRPIRCLKQIWRPSTWNKAADDLWSLFERTRCIELWWLGLRAAVGALIWLTIPASMMIIGLRADELKIAGIIGLIGALSLTWVMLFLPFLQILMAERDRFQEIFNVREVRKRFRHAPLAMAFSLIALFSLSIPLYLLRIEATPDQLTWLPSLFFVGLMFPSKLALGAAMGYGARRPKPRNFAMRWSARLLCVAASLAYVGALYIAQFIAWQGIYVMYFQHAVLVPVAN